VAPPEACAGEGGSVAVETPSRIAALAPVTCSNMALRDVVVSTEKAATATPLEETHAAAAAAVAQRQILADTERMVTRDNFSQDDKRN